MKLNWNWNGSIRSGLQTKLVAWFFVLIFVPMAIVGFFSVRKANNIMMDTLNKNTHTALSLVDQNITSFFEGLGHSLNGLSKTDVAAKVKSGKQDDVLGVFQEFLSNSPQVSSVYIGTADGKMVIAPAQELPKDYDPRVRPWYKKALESPDKIVWTDPYKDASTGDMLVSGAKVIKENGTVIGVLSLDIKLTSMSELVKTIHIGDTGYVFITTNSGVIIAHPDKAMLAQDMNKEEFIKKMISNKSGFLDYEFKGEKKILSYSTATATGWKLAANMKEEELTADANTLRNITLLIGLLGTIAAGLVGFWIARGIVRPLQEINGALQKAERGDLSVSVAHVSADEVGELSQAFNNTVANLRRLVSQVANNSEQVAASSEELYASAEQCAKAAEQVAQTIQEIATGATKQVKNVDETTTLIQQMAAGLQQVASNAQSVSTISQQTAQTAVTGVADIANAVQQMQSISSTVNDSSVVVKKLGQRSMEIGQIVDVISGIANQTNLLALNAAIEAARAGEQGRGFAVVAEEVRKLAEQSGQAAERIAVLIREIQSETERAVISMEAGTREVAVGTEVVNRAGVSFDAIQKAIQNVVAQVQEITAATNQMATNSGQIVLAVDNVESIACESALATETISAASEEQNASMEEVSAASQNLAQLAGDLQQTIHQFKI